MAGHQTVLLNETLDYLKPAPGETIFEGTAGEGGLSLEIAGLLGKSGTLIVTDLDEMMLERTAAKLDGVGIKIIYRHDNFRDIRRILEEEGITSVDGIVLDLGSSSPQIEESGRGFTFRKDEPLVMTFQSRPEITQMTAETVVNKWSKESLEAIISGFGGEKHATKIAESIVKHRPILSTAGLVRAIEEIVSRAGAIHPATRTFQAIRMTVNDELGALKQVLADGWLLLSPGGRLVVISFHELEDREVKNFLRLRAEIDGEILTKKAVMPERKEVITNRRSHSAKLRAIQKK